MARRVAACQASGPGVSAGARRGERGADDGGAERVRDVVQLDGEDGSGRARCAALASRDEPACGGM